MAKILDYISLARPYQWYKNLIVFLAIFFVGGVFDENYLKFAILAFITLSLASSSNYVINDLLDKKKDRLIPLKKNRPIAKGSINLLEGFIFALILMTASLLLSYSINPYFVLSILILLILTQSYSVCLKNQVLLDIIIISVNFVIRAISGAAAINVRISPWLVITPFFLALLLAAGKRKGELHVSKGNLNFRPVLKHYSDEILDNIIILSSALFIISYGLFSFLSIHKYLIFTLPFAVYTTLRYNMITIDKTGIVSPGRSIKDIPLLASMLLWIAAAAFLIYL